MLLPLPEVPGGFGCIVADPAWQFGNRASRGAAEDHYETMPEWEIMFLDVERIAAENAHLYLWTTDAHLPFALSIMKTWGFTFKQTIKWCEVKDGEPQMGMGNYIRHASELCLFGVRGRQRTLHADEIDFFWAPRAQHSKKPDEFYEKYPQRLSPGPWLEMFARVQRPGWWVWGLEAPKLTLVTP